MNIGLLHPYLATPGDTFEIPVTISNIPKNGLNNFDFTLKFDNNVFESLRIDKGNIFPISDDFIAYCNSQGIISFLFNDSTQGKKQLTQEGILAKLVFKVKNNSTPGSYSIEVIKYGTCSTLNSDGKMEHVDIDFNNTSVLLTEKDDNQTNTPLNSATSLTSETPVSSATPTVSTKPSTPTPAKNSQVVSISTPSAKVTPIVLVTENKKLVPNGIPADLAISVKTDKNIYKENDIIKFDLKYLNRLNKPATDVVINAQIPDGTVVIPESLSPSGTVKDNIIEWKLDKLDVGKINNISFQLKVGKLPIAMAKVNENVSINSNDNILENNDNKSSARFLLVKSDNVFNHKKFMNGYPDGTIKPDKQITRAEVAVLFTNLLSLDTSNDAAVKFKDVNPDHWAYKYINAVAKEGIFKGSEVAATSQNSEKTSAPIITPTVTQAVYRDSQTTTPIATPTVAGEVVFNPDKYITRAELATAIARYLNLGENITPIEVHFKDLLSHWSMKYVEEVYRLNIVSGYQDGNFNPNNNITRAEVLVMLNRMTFRGPLALDEKSPFTDLSKNHWAYRYILESTVDHETQLFGDVEAKDEKSLGIK
ncbi:MAG: S-layer homology domain-containing protein [Bacillota bacterium]|nr:S-layer homology domain-containing protein [Bacillota bacterium]